MGINSIQTARDRLKADKANFKVLDIKDGVSLYRNPQQTMDKLKTLIQGLKNEDSLDSFWEGAINDSKLGMIPVYVPNLLDHSTKILDKPAINRIINEAMPDLDEDIKKVIVYYIDIDDEKELMLFIKEYNLTNIDIELRDLKQVLDDVVVNDEIDFELKEENKIYTITFKRFISDRLLQKIDEYNQKKTLNSKSKKLIEDDDAVENDDDEKNNSFQKGASIQISDEGLELIELISLDCTNDKGAWQSDEEIKIDKNGFVLKNGKKTKTFWDATITSEKKPLRMKVRNIAGDETVQAL